MEELQEEKALKKFSWYALFAVTSFSCFLFAGVLKFLEGSYSTFFVKAGLISLLVSLFLWLLHRPSRPRVQKEKDQFSGTKGEDETYFQ